MTQNLLFRKLEEGEWESIVAVRGWLAHHGYSPIPAMETLKAPAFVNWSNYSYDPGNPEPPLPRGRTNARGEPTRAPHLGTAVLCAGLAAIDIDITDHATAALAREAFEDSVDATHVVRSRPNSGSQMLFYLTMPGMVPITPAAFAGDLGKVEVFANCARRVAFVHGVHPSGARIDYEDAALWEVPRAELPELTEDALRTGLHAVAKALGGEVRGLPAKGAARRSGSAAGSQRRDTAFQAEGGPRAAVTRRDLHELAGALDDLLTAKSITPSAIRIAEILGLQCHIRWGQQIDDFLLALISRGRARNPAADRRYDNLRKQIVQQRPSLGHRICAISERHRAARYLEFAFREKAHPCPETSDEGDDA